MIADMKLPRVVLKPLNLDDLPGHARRQFKKALKRKREDGSLSEGQSEMVSTCIGICFVVISKTFADVNEIRLANSNFKSKVAGILYALEQDLWLLKFVCFILYAVSES